MAFVTATMALTHYWSDNKFQASVVKKSLTVTTYLDNLVKNYPEAGMERRGRGLMQGLSFKDANLANRVTTLAFENGLIIETSGGSNECIKLLTPLTIEPEKLLAGLDILMQAVADALSDQSANKAVEQTEVTA
jgi:diaminobutyrate-2-oxoglutarate transaminase